MAQSTTEYKKFKYLRGNRGIDKAHVANITKSMALYPDLFQTRPILVNGDFEIIDGQHRFRAAKEMGIPVWYEVADGLKSEAAQVLNMNQRNWSLFDFARSYAAAGNDNYSKFLEAHKEHPLVPAHTIIRYISGPGANNTVVFRSGEFKAKTYDFGMVYLEMLEELIEINRRFGMSTPSQAMFSVFQNEAYDHDRMLRKLGLASGHLELWGSIEHIYRNLEDIYNFKQSSDIVRFY